MRVYTGHDKINYIMIMMMMICFQWVLNDDTSHSISWQKTLLPYIPCNHDMSNNEVIKWNRIECIKKSVWNLSLSFFLSFFRVSSVIQLNMSQEMSVSQVEWLYTQEMMMSLSYREWMNDWMGFFSLLFKKNTHRLKTFLFIDGSDYVCFSSNMIIIIWCEMSASVLLSWLRRRNTCHALFQHEFLSLFAYFFSRITARKGKRYRHENTSSRQDQT